MKKHTTHLSCLAAGQSTRLLPLTEISHKAMLPVAGYAVVDVQLRTFRAAGIQTCNFVLGHGRSELAERIQLRKGSLEIEFQENYEFRERNMDWSAFLALSATAGDTVYYEGDVLVHPSVIDEVAKSSADICLVADAIGRSHAVDTRVIVRDSTVQGLLFAERGIAELPIGSNSAGELVCVIKFSNDARRFIVDKLQTCNFTGQMRLYDIFNEAISVFSSECIEVRDRPWIEIDNEHDLLRAQQVASSLLGVS